MVARAVLVLLLSSASAACSAGQRPSWDRTGPHADVDYQAVVNAPDRSDADRALDAGRRPAELLAVLGVKQTDRVAELQAGGGYTSELLARAVGPEGVVFAQNNAGALRWVGDAWPERLARLDLPQLRRVDRELDAPLPPDARQLDLVVSHLTYHDAVGYQEDRAKMNAAVLAALRPGGRYAIIDHAAAIGADPLEAAKTLHRIPETFVVTDVEAAGFRLVSRSPMFANPADDRTWSTAPSQAGDKRGTSDRFVLVFEKP
jgi:predicted methyltransferase